MRVSSVSAFTDALSDAPRVVLVQIWHGGATTPAAPRLEIRLAIVDCQLPEGERRCNVLAADFFDDESIIVVYRAQKEQSECCAPVPNFR
jgi:hypothetical protein